MVHQPTGKLREALEQPDHQERLEATRNLLDSAGRLRPDLLVPLLCDPSRAVQDAAADQLIDLGGEESIALLLPLLEDRDASVRNQAKAVLTEIAGKGLPQIAAAIDDASDDARILMVEALGEAGDADALELIAAQRDSDNVNLRNAVATALGQLRSADAVPALVELLRDDEWVRFSAIDSLSLIDDPSVNPQVIAALKNARGSAWYGGVLACLVEMRSPEAVAAMLQELDYVDQRWDAELVGALLELTTDSAFNPENLDPALLSKALPKLAAITASDDPWVAFRACGAIGALGSRAGLDALLSAARDKRDLVAAGALKALARLAIRADLPKLQELREDASDALRKDVDALIERLSAEEPSV